MRITDQKVFITASLSAKLLDSAAKQMTHDYP